MYFSKATALAVVASLRVTLGSPTLNSRQNGVTCQSSDGSPLTGDVTAAINELRGGGGTCFQNNGADCTTVVQQESAAIGVCGGVDDDDSALSCADVAAFANQIQQTCLTGDRSDPDARSGGTFTVSASKRIVLINTSSV